MTDTTELIAIAAGLKPREYESRLAYFESGAGQSWLNEFVTGSREADLPVDKFGNIKDRLDQQIREARREYRNSLALAERHLLVCVGLEKRWLFPIEVATEDLAELVSDFPSCLGCGETREQWERKHRGQRIRIKRGCFPNCYEDFRRSGEEFGVWSAKRKALEATG